MVTFDEDPSDFLIRDACVPHFLAGGGEVAALMRALPWPSNPLGPPSDWPLELKTLVGVMLAAGQPMFIAWGAERTLLYNDAYTKMIGDKHPGALGDSVNRVFSEAWTELDPLFQKVFSGVSIHMDDLTLMLDRAGVSEETHFNFSYTPVRDASSNVVALFCAATETTSQVLSQRALLEDREHQRELLQQMPGFVALLRGPEHIYEYVNAAYVRMSGPRQFIGRPVRDVFPELADQGFYQLLDNVYATGLAFKSPAVPIRLAGEMDERFLDLLYEPIKADDGSVDGVFVGGYDVTEAHRASESLRDSEGYIRLLLASTSEGFYAVDCDGRTTLCNTAFLTMLGFQAESEVIGRKLHDVIHHTHADGSTYESTVCPLYLCASTGKAAHVRDEFFYHADGSALPVEYWAHPIIQNGELRGAICNFRDVTEQRENEAALRELNETLEHRVETRTMERDRAWKNSQDLQVVVGADGRFRAVNKAWTTILGWQPEDLIGRDHLDLSHPDDRAASRKIMAMATLDEIPKYENRCLHKDGGYRWISWVAAPDDGLIYASGRHITADKEIVAALATMQARTQTMFETSFQMQGLCAVDGTLLSANSTALAVIDATIDEVVGKLFWETPWFAATPDMPDLIRAAIEAGAAGHSSRREIALNVLKGQRTYDFSIRPIRDTSDTVIGVVSEALDITERRNAEESLRQSRKLEAMGQLTGGVAHDFNNLLTPIMLSLDMLRERGVGSERDQRRIGQAIEATNRARTLVQRLLAFARRQPLMPVAVDIRHLVDGMLSLLVSTLGPSIVVSADMPDELPAAHVDANQLEMAILNLGVNARDAMPHGGTLTLSGSSEWIDMGHRSALSPGSFIRLCVSDTGTGMDDETLTRAIEPFFSTKAVGKGTGLGLSMVHGLASQLGGALTIATRLNVGTDIELWLPVSEQRLVVEQAVTDGAHRVKATGVALLVDDDELVRAVTADMLDEMGYQVVEAASAEAALKILEQGLPIDALITDHLMPGMSGTDLARKVLSSHPKVRVLVMSGYADAAAFAPDIPHLTKPFRVDDLAALLIHSERQGQL